MYFNKLYSIAMLNTAKRAIGGYKLLICDRIVN